MFTRSLDNRPKLDEYFLRMLELVATRSTCIRRSVGCIITDKRGSVLATGYNGVPSGIDHCINKPCLGAADPKGDTTRCKALHAEISCLLQCQRIDLAHTLYVSVSPCFACAKAICNTPIQRIVFAQDYVDLNGKLLLKEKGIQLIHGA